MQCPDNYDAYRRHEARQERELTRLPVCSYCNDPIQSEKLYIIDDEFFCPECVADNFEKFTDDYIE